MELHNLPIFYDDQANVRGYLDLLTTATTRQYLQVHTMDGEHFAELKQSGFWATLARVAAIATLIIPLIAYVAKIVVALDSREIKVTQIATNEFEETFAKMIYPGVRTEERSIDDLFGDDVNPNFSVLPGGGNGSYMLADGSSVRGEYVNGVLSGVIHSDDDNSEYILPYKVWSQDDAKVGGAQYNVGTYRRWDGRKFSDRTIPLYRQDDHYKEYNGSLAAFAEIVFQDDSGSEEVGKLKARIATMLFRKYGNSYPIVEVDVMTSGIILQLYRLCNESDSQEGAILVTKECARALYPQFAHVSAVKGKLEALYPELKR